jgi:O-antigen/teichoic acid export membrane protein
MKMFRAVFRNASFLFSYQTLNKALFTLLTILIARRLGPDALGTYAFVFVVEYMILLFVSMGSHDYIIREISRDPSKTPSLVGNLLVLNTVLMFVSFAPVMAASGYLGGELSLLIRLIWLDAFIASYMEIAVSVARAYEKMRYEAYAWVIHDVLVVSASSWAILSGYGMAAVLAAFIAGKALAFAYISTRLFGFAKRPRLAVDVGVWRDLFFRSAPFMVNGAFTLILLRFDLLLIGLMLGQREVGLYESAYSVVRNLSALAIVFVTAIYPQLARAGSMRQGILHDSYRRALRYFMVLNVALLACLAVFAEVIILTLFGSQYSESVGLLRILAGVCFILNLTAFNSCMLNAMNMERRNLMLIGAASALNIALNWVFIPVWGLYGAASATALAYLSLFALQSQCIREGDSALSEAAGR